MGKVIRPAPWKNWTRKIRRRYAQKRVKHEYFGKVFIEA